MAWSDDAKDVLLNVCFSFDNIKDYNTRFQNKAFGWNFFVGKGTLGKDFILKMSLRR